MKKSLLLAAVAVSAMTANAQLLNPTQQMQKVQMQQSLKAKNVAMATVAGPKKNVTDGVYYVRPEGSYVYGWDKEGYGYYNAWVVVPPYTDFELVNMCTKKANSTWNWVGEDASDMVNDDNNFAWYQNGATGYYMPTVASGKTEYTWGQTDNTYGDNYQSAMRCLDVVSGLTITDPHMGSDYIGWGYLSSHFLFGDGQLENEGVTYQCYGVEQSFPKPMSPLYVEDIYMNLLNFDSETFLEDGEQLTLDIVNEEGEVLYTLTAGADDIEIQNDGEAYESQYGDMRFAQAVFTMKDVDPLTGDVAAVPFVLDEPYSVIISGFEGKNIGFRGHFCMDDDDNPTAEASVVEKGYNLFYNVDDETETVAYTFQSNIAVPLSFSAIFDNAMVWTSAYLSDGTELSDFNVLNVSADGKTVENEGYADVNYTAVNTASSWYDEDEAEVYYLSDANGEFPDWLAYGVDNSAWTDYDEETENPGPSVYVGVECEALPEGVAGRGCKLYVNGRGIVSQDPIYVLQGDYTKEQCDADEAGTGINSVLAPRAFDGKTYSIAGQRVSKSTKGIIVKDGKKFLNK